MVRNGVLDARLQLRSGELKCNQHIAERHDFKKISLGNLARRDILSYAVDIDVSNVGHCGLALGIGDEIDERAAAVVAPFPIRGQDGDDFTIVCINLLTESIDEHRQCSGWPVACVP